MPFVPGPIVTELDPNLKTKGSPNKTIIGSLVSTLQRKVEPEKLYDALRKMNDDLNKTYTALFDGPLPAVDGFALTRLNAAVLSGPLPELYHIAYTDRINTFIFGQFFEYPRPEEPFLEMGIGDTTTIPPSDPFSFFRLGAIADTDFFISQNLSWDGAGWNQDDVSDGSCFLEFSGGILSFHWFDSVLGDLRKTFRFEGNDFTSESFDQTDSVSFLAKDDNDVVHAGNSADGATPSIYGWFAIPVAALTSFPPGDVKANGIIGINKTTNRFVFYANGNRYYVQGIAF